MKKKISIVTPTFNEESNIEKLCNLISDEMNKLNYDYEHIVIDNCSSDSTVSILKKLALLNKNLKIIVNTRNFGHIKSPIHGILQANGDAVILMSSDFQDPISLIPTYLEEWEKGNKVVMAQKSSSDENMQLNFIRKFFYKTIRFISETPLLLNTTGAGLFDRKIIEEVRSINDPYPYFRGLVSEITSEIKLIKFHQPKRAGGITKNNFYTLYDIAVLGIIKHSKLPLRILTFIGLVTSFLSLIVATVYLFLKLFNWESFEIGVAPLVIGFFFIASIQIFLLGFIGEYVMNILTHSRKLPLVIEKERINF
ncbi:glycosyltransferase family 2 protein [Pelagibacteraceae bacterium]|nr:glycosyltransferase family 2 protein [Pelagibacteraceae bacterium]